MTDPNYNLPNPSEETIDLRKWIGKLFANWYWFVICVIVFGSGAYILTKYLEPSYQAQATLVIKDESKNLGSDALFKDLQMFGKSTNLQNEIGVIKSWSLARRTLDQLNFDISYAAVGRWTECHLYENIPFRVIVGPNSNAYADLPIYVSVLTDSTFQLRINGDYNINITHKFNEAFYNKNFNFILSRNPDFNINLIPDTMLPGDYYFTVNNLDKLAYQYMEKLSVELFDKEGSILLLTSTGFSAKKEADYLNTLMDEYTKAGLEAKNRTAQNTVDFIDDQLAGIKDTLRMAEENLSIFRSKNQVINLTTEGQAIFEKMDQLTQERALVDLQVRYYEYLLDYLKNSKNFSDVMAPSTMGINDQILSSLLDKLMDLSSRKASLEYSATENFQALNMVNLEIKANQEALMENVRNILNTAKFNQEDVVRRTNNLNFEIRKLPETERQFLNIQRRYDIADEIYTYLSQRRAEAAIIEASNVPDQIIIDPARVDSAEKVSPKNRLNYALGVLLGLFLPFSIIVLIDFFNTKIREKEDVEKVTQVPVIGSVGHNKKDAILPVVEHTRSSIAESFRAIRTDLQFLLYKEDKKVIMITSTIANEGKSFIAMNLAGIFSVTGKKAVMVGLDLRKPVIHNLVKGIDNKEGVSTYLIGKSKIEDIIFPSDYKNFSFIPAGPIAPNPAELLETEEFEKFIVELKSRFDIIILDTPPVALVTDASLIAKHTDVNLFIVRQNYTNKSALAFIDKFAAKGHVKSLNIIINDVVVPKYYGYKYGYGYGYGYGKGYGSGYYVEK